MSGTAVAKRGSPLDTVDVTNPVPILNSSEVAATESCGRPDTTAGCDDAIRERAFGKWQAAGCPPGDGVSFWLEAETELLAESGRTD